MVSRGGSRSGEYWLFVCTRCFSHTFGVYYGVTQAAAGVMCSFRVRACCSVLIMLFIGYDGNNAALGQVRYLFSDI